MTLLSFAMVAGRGQFEIASNLLIGCGKLENSVHICGKSDCVVSGRPSTGNKADHVRGAEQ
jgi:hypothetical protein